ncbi:hypothetical protein U1Q18_043038 [Sarracenia purpurea var. burkii]
MNNFRGESNKFKVLDSEDFEKWFPALESSEGSRSNPSRVLRDRSSLVPVDLLHSGRSLDDVFRDVATLRHDLLKMAKEQSIDPQGKRAILATVKKLETEEKRVRGPPFDSARLTNLEARIRRLNKIKESAFRDSQVTSEVVEAVHDGVSAPFNVKKRDEVDEGCDKAKVTLCDSIKSPGDKLCVFEVPEEAPVSAKVQTVHMEGLSDCAHQVFDDMSHPVCSDKPVDKRDTDDSEEDEDEEDCDDDSSSNESDALGEEDSGIATCPQETNCKGASKEQNVAGASKTWAHVVAKDTLPHVMPRLSSLSSKIDLVDLGPPNDPNVLEIEGLDKAGI